ncbi:MAG TPA: hypothetical protein VGI97_14745 [Gemmatimonadaceae bacterium]|jgi:hypothetical protein
MKKTLFTLAVDGYAPEITALTFPLFERYADKIGADFHIITERKFPEFPPVYEKLQIHELGREMGNDWNIFLDADALVHPDMFDVTAHLSKDTVFHHGTDPASLRFRPDRFFHRDGRNIGSCNWCTIASDWCIDLWKPLADLTLEQATANIFPTANELACDAKISRCHLIDDYTLSRNIAQNGFKVQTLGDVMKRFNFNASLFWHAYTMTREQKVVKMKEELVKWKV